MAGVLQGCSVYVSKGSNLFRQGGFVTIRDRRAVARDDNLPLSKCHSELTRNMPLNTLATGIVNTYTP